MVDVHLLFADWIKSGSDQSEWNNYDHLALCPHEDLDRLSEFGFLGKTRTTESGWPVTLML